MENPNGDTPAARAARELIQAGFAPIPIPAKSKNPNRNGWQTQRVTLEDVPELWDNGQNVGLLMGEPSGGLVCIDLDRPEASAVAPYLLPKTRTGGREGRPRGHRFYLVEGPPPKTVRYTLPGSGQDRRMLELLSTGTQVVVAPSVHPSGERYTQSDCTVTASRGEELTEYVENVALASALVYHYPGTGCRHDYVLAATGFLGRRLPASRVEQIMTAAIESSGDEEATSRHRDVEGTLDKLARNEQTTGGPTLDELAPGLVGLLQRWGNLKTSAGAGESSAHFGPGAADAVPLPLAMQCTDLGNAKRYAEKFDGRVIHSGALGGFGVWDGRRFERDERGRAVELAKSLAPDIMREAEHAISTGDTEGAKKLSSWSIASCFAAKIEAALKLAKSEANIAVGAGELDAHPYLLNTENGVLDLRTGDLGPHDPEKRLTKVAPVPYDPEATAPAWSAFLERVLPSEALRHFVQKLIGYCLTGDQGEQILPFLYGTGANGKSTFVNTILELLGDYAQQAAPELLMVKAGAHPTELAELKARRLVASVEIDEGRKLAESLVKQLTGGEKIRARFMRQDFFEFWPEHHVFLVANHKPIVRGTDHAMWRRIKLIPFTVTIPVSEQDSKLAENLKDELPGILRWAVEGCLLWQSEGLGEPEEVRAATEEYREEQDVLGAFLSECCYVDERASARFKTLYAVYCAWCEESNERAVKKRAFGVSLDERGFPSFKGTGNASMRRGLGVLDDAPHPGGGGLFKSNSDTSGVTYDNCSDSSEKTNNANLGGGVTHPKVTREGESCSKVTHENTCKTEEFTGGVTDSYQKSGLTPYVKSKSASYRIPGNSSNSVTPTPSQKHLRGRPLTEEQDREVQRLIGQGMAAKVARAEVLGEEGI
jgi:P4 family phage/plasmid primase-like protien